jgi:hypothetical protein
LEEEKILDNTLFIVDFDFKQRRTTFILKSFVVGVGYITLSSFLAPSLANSFCLHQMVILSLDFWFIRICAAATNPKKGIDINCINEFGYNDLTLLCAFYEN